MKNTKKILGIAAMFIGLTALCAVDSEVPLWGTMLMVLVGIAGLFGVALCTARTAMHLWLTNLNTNIIRITIVKVEIKKE